MKYVTNESSFVLRAGKAWGRRSIPSKGPLINRDDGMISMKDNGQQMHHRKHRQLLRALKR